MSDRVAMFVYIVLIGIAVVATVAWQARLIEEWAEATIVAACSVGWFVVLRGVRRKYRPYVFTPLSEKQLAWRDRRHFARYTPALEQLGFRQLGDFQLLPRPVEEVARILVSGDGECFAVIVRHEEIEVVTFCSLAADGTYFESAVMLSDGVEVGPGVPLRCQFLGDVSMDEAAARHQQFIHQCAQSQGTEVVDCQPDDFRHVLEYGHRLAGWDLYHQGHRSNTPPPLPDFIANRFAASP